MFKKLVVCLLMGVATMVFAAQQYIYSTKDIAVVFNPSVPCSNAKMLSILEMAQLPKEWKWFEAKVLYDGEIVAGCAAQVDDSTVVVVTVEGQGGYIPLSDIRPLREA